MKTNTIKYSTRYMHMCILANIKALHRMSHLRLLAGAFIFCQRLGRDCVRSLRTLHSSAPAFCLPTCHRHRVIKLRPVVGNISSVFILKKLLSLQIKIR